ncbi:MAG TPA: hemagglutination activity domain protein [Cyanobacteria bacterium UBA9273]|nr:hemagglutination activity domain protein [Cyanobacteria bacterium UBA9273]
MGANAQLNVPADFTAATATRIGFGNDNWFNTAGANDYSALVGTPHVFYFGLSGTPGAIANAGNLTIGEGRNLNLIGGTVVSTGQLTALGGNIKVVAVPGEHLVRISQPGHLLSLEVQPSQNSGSVVPNPLSLPALLTGSPQLQTITGLTFDPTTGQLKTSSGLIVPDAAGTVLVSGNINASATTASQNGGSVQLLGKSVGFFGEILATGTVDGSTSGFVQVSGQENLTFDGTVNTTATNGDRGTLELNSNNLTLIDASSITSTQTPNLAPSPFDPNRLSNAIAWGQIADLILKNNLILQGTGDMAIADVVGNTSPITQNNQVTLGASTGNLTIRSTQGAITFADPNDTIQTSGSGITFEAFNGITAGNLLTNRGAVTLTAQTGNITAGDINTSSTLADGGAVALTAQTGSITTGRINTSSTSGNGGRVTLNAPTGITVDSINTQSFGNGTGGSVDITSRNWFRAIDTFSTRGGISFSIATAGGAGGGSIVIRHGIDSPGNAFTVGEDYNGVNGTIGIISTGSNNQITSGLFLGSYSQGIAPSDIQLVSPETDNLLADNALPKEYLPPSLEEEMQLSTDLLSSASILPVEIDTVVGELEESFTNQFQEYFGSDVDIPSVNLSQARGILGRIERETKIKPALIYAVFIPATVDGEASQPRQAALPTDQLELVAITATGHPIRKPLKGVTRQQVLNVAQEFRSNITNAKSNRGYYNSAQQLYRWLVAPLTADLKARGIENLVFILDSGLRSIPIAALHDGQGFLVERYSVSLMPSVTLTDTSYGDIKYSQVLAMGAEKFSDQKPLPAVPVELSLIASHLWKGKSFLNDTFTLENLKAQREQTPYGIIHLATHADFQPGEPDLSYIQLTNAKLRLNQLRQLGWNDPPVELLVLSACRTALGDEQAELGFAGLAVQAGVKSALASLWYVSDEGTLGLMTKFYEQLKSTPIKAEALRQAQLAMIRGQVRIESGKLRSDREEVPLPPALAGLNNQQLNHPYYWAAFTMIGNPW